MTIASAIRTPRAPRQVTLWLYAMAALVALMVLVGGATRLTDSGLSIVEWRPITGAVPPLSNAAWLEEFEKYKSIPEYAQVNHGMSLAEFKTIYWWEWAHRFLGRVIGIFFIAPLIWFVLRRQIDRALGLKLFGIFVLGGLQGALGWWMVSSGLSERIDVSQYRLAAHLALALALFAAILWLAFETGGAPQFGERALAPYAMALFAGVYAQIILGAFVAGLRAGHVFNTWPLMDGRFFPEGFFSNAPRFADLFETAAAVQFNHRLGAYLLLAAALAFFVHARKSSLKRRAGIVLAAVIAQALLGVMTVLAATPISLGLAHQAMALVVFAATLRLVHGSFTSMSKPGSSAAT